jgi:class 3 adenylate cyclase
MDVSHYAPSADPALRTQIASFFRRSASPGAALALLRMNTQIDIRPVLPVVRVPTLVLHRRGDLDANIEEGRWIATQIPGARFLDTAGDGFLATFEGPARAVRCAGAIRDAVATLGIRIRAGLHTGECEVMGDTLSGLAVHIGARVAAAAGPGEVWVSSTVKDLVAGSNLRFADRGLHVLKGIPGEWRLFAVEP